MPYCPAHGAWEGTADQCPACVTVELPVRGRCNCRTSANLPLRVLVGAARAIRHCNLDPDMPVQTWQCARCKAIVVLTAKDLHLVA